MALSKEIPLLILDLSGRVERFSDRDIDILDDNGVLRFYKGYIRGHPRISQSVDLETGSGELSTFNVELANVGRLQDLAETNFLDGALVDFVKYNLDTKQRTDTINGIVRSYKYDQDTIKLNIELKFKKIFIRVPEKVVEDNSFNIVFSGIADTWDETWEKKWVTDLDLVGGAVYADDYWRNGRIRIKTINPAKQNRVEFIEKRITQFTSADGKVIWEVWRLIRYLDIRQATYMTARGPISYTISLGYVNRYAGATELNVSTNFVLEKDFIPEKGDDVIGTAYPIVYGPVDKMVLPWIAADYQHSNDKYLLAGHPIFDSTSVGVLLWYDLEEKDPPDADADVIGGEVPNPMKVTHSGIIEGLGSNTIQDNTLSSDYINEDTDDFLKDRQHIDNNFFGSDEGWGTLRISLQGGGVETRYINDLRYDAATKGTLTVTENFSANVAVGDVYEIDLSGYSINSDTTDNFSNKIAYAQLAGDERNPSLSFDNLRPHLHWNLRRGLGNSKVYATFRGHKDDSVGTITGIANSLIENPIDVIKHFMLNYTLIRDDVNLLDIESFEIAKKKRLDWKFGGAITETDEGETFLERFCSQSGIIYYWKDGKFKIKAIDVDTPKTVFKFEENVNIYEGIKVKRTTIEKIKNNIHIMYKYSWVKDDFIFRVIKDKNTDRFCNTSAGRYGDSEPKEIEAWDIYETSTALKLGNYLVKLFADIYYIVTMKIPKSYFAVELGDIITITHSIGASLTGTGWVDKKFIVIKVQDKFVNMELTVRSFIES